MLNYTQQGMINTKFKILLASRGGGVWDREEAYRYRCKGNANALVLSLGYCFVGIRFTFYIPEILNTFFFVNYCII